MPLSIIAIVACHGDYNDLGSIHYLKEDIRMEFRSIYESIIDSTIASMY